MVVHANVRQHRTAMALPTDNITRTKVEPDDFVDEDTSNEAATRLPGWRAIDEAFVHIVPARDVRERARYRDQIAETWVLNREQAAWSSTSGEPNFLYKETSLSTEKHVRLIHTDAAKKGNKTVADQKRVEQLCASRFAQSKLNTQIFTETTTTPSLHRDAHLEWLLEGLTGTLSTDWETMDASQPWLLFWITHSVSLLGGELSHDVIQGCIDLLTSCQDAETGGFGGGPKQFAHLAPTYAAVNCLATLRCKEAYEVVNRFKLYEFIRSIKQPDGSFAVHMAGGENDLRAVYCALTACTLLNIPRRELLFDSTVIDWVRSCQSYQGGFGEVPGAEAHGGYTYCAVAVLFILDALSTIDVHQCLRWCTQQQKPYEGGFCGRSNKLVDSCYSLWTAGAIPLLQNEIIRQAKADCSTVAVKNADTWLFDTGALQEYVIVCCQASSGGLRDKPGKPVDYYHTAYALAGASLAQHQPNGDHLVLGDAENMLVPIHPAFNLTVDAYADITKYFGGDQNAENALSCDETRLKSGAMLS